MPNLSRVYESRLQPATSETRLVQRLADLLRGPTAGLVTDVDGTISPIVEHPADALVLPSARDALRRLRDRLAVVAVVSGRTVKDARRMVGVDGLVYVGNHGHEILTTDGPTVVPEARPWVPRLAGVLDNLRKRVDSPGVLIENKGATASIHYRTADDPDAARMEILGILATHGLTSGLRVEEGRMVVNLLPPLRVSKGSAVTWLARERELTHLAYLGDDLTDAHAFQALAVLRETADTATLSIGVVGDETPPPVRQLADVTVPSVESVARVLAGTADALDADAAGARANHEIHAAT
jgi:trehalose 6-phosphate phosphatase